MPLFGHNVDIFAFACNFTMEYFNDFTLSEYITIVFSINDNIHIIETGLKARDEPSSKLLTYLNDIKEEIANQNYFDAISKNFYLILIQKLILKFQKKTKRKKGYNS